MYNMNFYKFCSHNIIVHCPNKFTVIISTFFLVGIPLVFSSDVSNSLLYNSESKNSIFESFRQFPLAQSEAFIQRRLFNTSVALTVPLFAFTLPQRAVEGTSVDLANQAIFGLFSFLVTVLVFTVPVLFTGTRPAGLTGRSNDFTDPVQMQDKILDRLVNSKGETFNFMNDDIHNKIGINPTRCIQKTICQAHRNPKKYGLLATPFILLFPPPLNGTTEKNLSYYRLAAREGTFDKTRECGEIYKCFFDMLDLAIYFVDWWHYSNTDAYTMD